MGYKITSRDYLKRAKGCLGKNENQYLFYAAFEIRCGVEARMHEYLEVQKHISKKKKQGWQVAKLAKNIEHVVRLGEKVAILKILNKKTNKIEVEVKYTPVKRSLIKRVEKFGKYLHSTKNNYDSGHHFWRKFRIELEDAIMELEWATSGRLMGPLLKHKNKDHVHVTIELPTEKEMDLVKHHEPETGIILIVDYE